MVNAVSTIDRRDAGQCAARNGKVYSKLLIPVSTRLRKRSRCYREESKTDKYSKKSHPSTTQQWNGRTRNPVGIRHHLLNLALLWSSVCERQRDAAQVHA